MPGGYVRGGAFFISQPRDPKISLYPRPDMGNEPRYKTYKRVRGGLHRGATNRTPRPSQRGDAQKFFMAGEPGAPPYKQIQLKQTGIQAGLLSEDRAQNRSAQNGEANGGDQAPPETIPEEVASLPPSEFIKAGSLDNLSPPGNGSEAGSPGKLSSAATSPAKSPDFQWNSTEEFLADAKVGLEKMKKDGEESLEKIKKEGEKSLQKIKEDGEKFLDDAVIGLQKMARGRLARKNTQKLKVEKPKPATQQQDALFGGFSPGVAPEVSAGLAPGFSPDGTPGPPRTKPAVDPLPSGLMRCFACFKAPPPPTSNPTPAKSGGEYCTSLLYSSPDSAENFRASGFTRGAIQGGLDQAGGAQDNFRASGFTRGVIGAGIDAAAPADNFRASGFTRGAIGAGVEALTSNDDYKPPPDALEKYINPLEKASNYDVDGDGDIGQPGHANAGPNFRASGFTRGVISSGLDAHANEA